jgi:taurine dioxygenase
MYSPEHGKENFMNSLSEQTSAPGSFQHFEITPVTPTIGATIEGLHLSELNDESAEELRQAVWQYGVVFARDQHLTPEQQKRVGRCFGEELEEHSFGKTLKDEGHPEILVIEKMKSDKAKTTTDIWHHDVSARKHPNVASVLQAKQVPFGADTMWSSTSAAYDYLPHELKLLFLGLDVHGAAPRLWRQQNGCREAEPAGRGEHAPGDNPPPVHWPIMHFHWQRLRQARAWLHGRNE